MLMQLMQAWNMRMAVADSRNYREIVEMLVGIVRIHVRMFHGFVGMHMLVTLLQIHPDTPGHHCGGRQRHDGCAKY